MIKIENDDLEVWVDPKGAQLTHVTDKHTGYDYMWNNDAWPKHAPILFPAIGRSTNDEYLIKGKKYSMPQHGFVSDFSFETLQKKNNLVTLSFKSNEETSKLYPFKFAFCVTFKLEQRKLSVEFNIINESDESLSYSLGFHPAFNLNGPFESHTVETLPAYKHFDKFEIVKNPYPYRSGEIKPMQVDGLNFRLNHSLFNEGLIIFKNKINEVTLRGPEHTVIVNMEDFSNLCLWTKEDQETPFLCLEPFIGLPDKNNELQELSDKEQNAHLGVDEQKYYQVKMSFE